MQKRKLEPSKRSTSHIKKTKRECLLLLQRNQWSQQNNQHFTTSVISLSLMGRATDVKDTNNRRMASIAIPINPLTRASVTPEQNHHSIAYSQNLINAIDSFPLNPDKDHNKFRQLSNYIQHLSRENTLSKRFPNWQYIDFTTLENEIYCAYRTAEETVKIKSTFAKMIGLYQQAQQPTRVRHIQSQEHTVLNTIAQYIKEQPIHEVALKIIMPRSPMTATFQAHELHLIEHVQWKPGQNLSRICGIMIEITNPKANQKTIAYRYLCGLNTHITPQQVRESILLLKIKRYNATHPELQRRAALPSRNNTESLLNTLSIDLNRSLTESTRITRQQSHEIFQTGTTANNLNTPLRLELIDKRNPDAVVHRNIIAVAQQSIEPLSEMLDTVKKENSGEPETTSSLRLTM
jgi:hypothetical protein